MCLSRKLYYMDIAGLITYSGDSSRQSNLASQKGLRNKYCIYFVLGDTTSDALKVDRFWLNRTDHGCKRKHFETCSDCHVEGNLEMHNPNGMSRCYTWSVGLH